MNGLLIMNPEAHTPEGVEFLRAVHSTQKWAEDMVTRGDAVWAQVWVSRVDGHDTVHGVHPGNVEQFWGAVNGRVTWMLGGVLSLAVSGVPTIHILPPSHDNAEQRVRTIGTGKEEA